MVLCLVLGKEVTDRFIFDISIEMWTSMKISHLQNGIKEKASLSVPAYKIKLWKVAIPTKDMNDEKMKILINKSHEFINVKEELRGELLDAEDSISSKIENVPADNHIHIIVELPKPATEKRKLEDSDEENGNLKKGKLLKNDKELVLNLINNLPDTNDKLFTVPALPGDDTDTVIYNRSCYIYLRDFILNDKIFNRYCITGNPGIGKVYFGRIMLVELLKQKKSVLIDYEGFTAWIEPNGSLLKINNEDRTTYRQVAGQKDV
ncbi:13195_t:CDS:2 [Funneliformis geosporum]|uniref:15806_t:CDS:1 n=1 Tax=Funneliformis geosporum TaxID=1117311 RepID=A0A9W4WVC7_9GLOM|nr:15806_t:CDS:2 [Funneliformis geosporum]CAI2178769.1 13195_t:CDS:2 [Funneliformis geosporum]